MIKPINPHPTIFMINGIGFIHPRASYTVSPPPAITYGYWLSKKLGQFPTYINMFASFSAKGEPLNVLKCVKTVTKNIIFNKIGNPMNPKIDFHDKYLN
jgi:hypothetical protein